ncbi:20beta-hydroxysteroid dehydrogenase [Beauveria bassiana ARSEF 2860]|uniref:20beta-hydroxysteroid dehydrogenase n=1 Tax=Beauveria bassiana (strain ARSEF 2860) TaxID=655819 RepID=J5JQB2_BEAB2|nr:20beta-hydroxysteroid dehydrogenase [Beauveria bassiana ARSEF 2860]EJP65056.1 20beta-hydroxysteroid dehydrogenase [Beauveria bassiana ARSEF 2860]
MSGAAAVFTPGSTALVTGGASGVGLAVAKLCHAKGMNVLLVDRNAKALEQAKLHIAGQGVDASDPRVVTSVADVSLSEDWSALKDFALAKFGPIEFLALNAGVGGKGTWGDGDYFRKILETNLFGVINGINTFLPVVQEASKTNRTAIVITGSKQGITNPPGNAAYNASKSAVKTLAEHLSWDLRETTTSVHLLVPGWTFTGMTKEKPAGAWAPEQVADFLYKKMEKSEFYVICPDNDVSEETDKKRMLWSVGDIVHGRPPLSRWRDEWKQEAEKNMSETKI